MRSFASVYQEQCIIVISSDFTLSNSRVIDDTTFVIAYGSELNMYNVSFKDNSLLFSLFKIEETKFNFSHVSIDNCSF